MNGVMGLRENGIYATRPMIGESHEVNDVAYIPEGNRWIDVINHICQIDSYVASILSHGIWDTVVSKKSYLVMTNHKLWKTLVVWKQRVKVDKKSSTITYRYMIYNEAWDRNRAMEFYRKVMAKDVVYSHGKVNIKKYNKRIDDNYRLKVNQKKQLEIQQKIQELQDRYNAIKYRRKEPYKTEKQKIKQLIKGYEQLLQQLKQAEKELKKKLKEKQNAKVLKI